MNGSSDQLDRAEAAALESLLRWYLAMGADTAIDADPHDRFVASGSLLPQPPESSRPAREAPPPRPLSVAAPASTDALVRNAEALAADATTIDDLRERWEHRSGCGLATTASRMIFAGGQPGAPLMLIGAAPESDDERHGEIFAGPRGRLLDGMLRAIGLDRSGVYLTNVIPWRPPGNRLPSQVELSICLPFTQRHIALADPAFILCLGERAAQPLFGSSEPISRLRGRWLDYESTGNTVKTLVTFSLSYLLSQPLHKRGAWRDLLMLADAMEPFANRSSDAAP